MLRRSSSGSSLIAGPQQVFRSIKAGLNTGVGESRHANTDKDVQDEESGLWKYLVVDPAGIRPRDDASYSKDTKGKGVERSRFKEGQVVEIARRRRSGWTRWLALKNGDGWLFDVSPKDKKVRLVEVEVAVGNWQYEADRERAPILTAPSTRQASMAAKSLGSLYVAPRETVAVKERIRPVLMKGSFLLLADGRGWTLDFLDGRQVLQRTGMPDAPEPGAGAMRTEFSASNSWGLPESGISAFSPPTPSSSSGRPSSGGYGSKIGSGNWVPPQHRTLQKSASACNVVSAELGPSEQGEWEYLVVDPKGFSLRRSPTYDQSQKTSSRIEEGVVATVVERRHGEGCNFLRIVYPSMGWAFDCQPGLMSHLRLMEVQVEKCSLHYVVVAEKGIAVRSRCSFGQDCKTGTGPSKGALVLVTQRVAAGDTTFLYINEETPGWIFDQKNGKVLVQGPVTMQAAPPDCLCEVKAEESFHVSCAIGCGLRDTPGLPYKASTRMDDPDGSRHAPWGSTVQGVGIDSDWVKVGESYLPRSTNGVSVLRAAGRNGVHLAVSPTHQRWAASKMFLLHNSKVMLSQLCKMEGEKWAKVSAPGGGMEGWMPERLLLGLPPPDASSSLAGPGPKGGYGEGPPVPHQAARAFNASEVAAAWRAPNPLDY